MLSIEYGLNEPPAPPAIPGSGRDWLKSRRVDGSLLTYYLSSFRPFLRTQPQWAKHEGLFDLAINAFHEFAGRQIELAAVSPELFGDFVVWLRTHASEASAQAVSHVLHCVLSSFDRNRFLVRQWTVARPGEAGYEVRHLVELEGEPGTFLHFWKTVYRPEVMATASVGHLRKALSTFKRLRECFGRDVLLSELSAERLAQFLAWLRSGGHNPGGVKLFRSYFVMVWRLAAERGLAAAVPRMRKMAVPREIPDAWTREELARLVAATSALAGRDVGGIPADKVFRAMILVGYWTALRRRSLRAIKPVDVDFESGWLYVHGGNMKSGRGKKFRLGPDAIDAVRDIFSADRELLFPACCARTLGKWWKIVLAAAGIPPSKHRLGEFHKLRRTAISLTASTAGLAAASALAGHSAAYVTDRYLDASLFVGNDATEWLEAIASEAAG